MTEISSIDEPPQEFYPTSPAPWQQIGALEVCLIAIGGFGSYVHSATRKKRAPTFQAQFPPNNAPPSIQPITPEDPPMVSQILPTPPTPQFHSPAPLPPPQGPFANLPCDADDQEKIRTVVRKLGSHEFFRIQDITELMGIKKDILHVHPFKFLWTIFSNENCKNTLKNIQQKASQKGFINGFFDKRAKNGFMDGVNEGMKREMDDKNIEPHIADFAASVGTKAEEICDLIEQGKSKENWVALVDHLIAL
ncbi:MAG TPA: hypothetical protein VLE89_08080 [Chlamydiales bacterium]|nr:hypothetical protein [Chlamydiales bacterium]